MSIKSVEEILEKDLGLTVEQINKMRIEEIERFIENKSGEKLKFPESLLPYDVECSAFYVGKISSPEKIEKELNVLMKKYLLKK